MEAIAAYSSWGFEKFKEATEEIKTHDVATRIFLQIALGAATLVIRTPFSISLIFIGEAALISLVALKLLLGTSKNDIEESLWFSAEMTPNFFENVILAPVIEEVLFRGILQPTVRFCTKKIIELTFDEAKADQVARITSIAVTSICFGAMHLTNPMCWEFVIIQSTHALIDGIVFGILREYSGSVVPCIMHHALWNWFASREVFVIIEKPLFVALDILLT